MKINNNYTKLTSEPMMFVRAHYGIKGYGVYMAFLQQLGVNGGKIHFSDIGFVALEVGVSQKYLQSVLDLVTGDNKWTNLIVFNGDYYSSPYVTKLIKQAEINHLQGQQKRGGTK